jgi:hypothetical protein
LIVTWKPTVLIPQVFITNYNLSPRKSKGKAKYSMFIVNLKLMQLWIGFLWRLINCCYPDDATWDNFASIAWLLREPGYTSY